MELPVQINFDANGLVPCVAQDANTGEVLMLAYANEEAVKRTLETGEMHFYSRSRAELWHKGETSGNVLTLQELRYDCDGDALLALVTAAGPACHTGERTCFYRRVGDGALRRTQFEALPELERVLVQRGQEQSSNSYSAKLLADRDFASAKVIEEADEVVRAVQGESDERVAEETADLLYHLAALLRGREFSVGVGFDVLNARRAADAEQSS